MAIVVLAIVLGWWGWNRTHPPDDPYANMLTAKVSRGDLTETISATGSIAAQTGAQVNIASQVTGTIKKLHADVGTFLHKGDIIAELDLPDIEAQYHQAEANYNAAKLTRMQAESGLQMQFIQTKTAIDEARSTLHSNQAKVLEAATAYSQQLQQTPSDIQRAQNALQVAQAALSTAKSNLAQTQASVNLEVATSQEQLTQAKANAVNSHLNLVRNQDLLKKGFVATSVVDQAQATDSVNQSLVNSAQENVRLTQEKVNADLPNAQDAVMQAQQNVDAAKAALDAAKAEVYLTQNKEADVKDARAQVNQAQAALAQAKGNIAQNLIKEQMIQQLRAAEKAAADQVTVAKTQYSRTFIRTPITGTVLQLAEQQGDTLAAGLAAPTLIVVCDLKRLEADVYVDETDIGKVKKGETASIVVDAYPKHSFTGKITKIAAGATIQQGVVTYDVTIILDKPGGKLLPDMTATATIQTGKRTNVLLVPAEAVKVTTRGSTVNVVHYADGKVSSIETRKVKTGASDGINTEIRDGLKEGETIVRAGLPTKGGGFGMNPFGPSSKGGGGKGGKM